MIKNTMFGHQKARIDFKYNMRENVELTINNNAYDRIRWNDTHKIWRFYWLSDGKKRIHSKFSCKEMFQRNKQYFKNATEPVMFQRIDRNEWFCNWSDDLLYELKKCNKQITRSRKGSNSKHNVIYL